MTVTSTANCRDVASRANMAQNGGINILVNDAGRPAEEKDIASISEEVTSIASLPVS